MALKDKIMDVAVDVRVESPTFARHVCVALDDRNRRQLWIPRGFAHGFVALSEEATLLYKCDAPYNRASEIGIRWNDPDIGIDWGTKQPILSEKDAALDGSMAYALSGVEVRIKTTMLYLHKYQKAAATSGNGKKRR